MFFFFQYYQSSKHLSFTLVFRATKVIFVRCELQLFYSCELLIFTLKFVKNDSSPLMKHYLQYKLLLWNLIFTNSSPSYSIKKTENGRYCMTLPYNIYKIAFVRRAMSPFKMSFFFRMTNWWTGFREIGWTVTKTPKMSETIIYFLGTDDPTFQFVRKLTKWPMFEK